MQKHTTAWHAAHHISIKANRHRNSPSNRLVQPPPSDLGCAKAKTAKSVSSQTTLLFRPRSVSAGLALTFESPKPCFADLVLALAPAPAQAGSPSQHCVLAGARPAVNSPALVPAILSHVETREHALTVNLETSSQHSTAKPTTRILAEAGSAKRLQLQLLRLATRCLPQSKMSMTTTSKC